MKSIIFTILLVISTSLFAQTKQVSSPDGNIRVEISLQEKVYYSVFFKNERVLEASPISMTLADKTLGAQPKILNSQVQQVNEQIKTVWGTRNTIADNYNLLTINFEGNYRLEFRAYNQGVAYRFVTSLKEKQIVVKNEEVGFRFNFGVNAWMADTKTYETNYIKTKLDVESIIDFKNAINKIYLPLVVQATPTVKVWISEAGLYDYPSLFLDRGNDYENFLNGTFEKYALTTKTGGFSNYAQITDQKADYIAATTGSREFPWRLMIISDDDRTFVDNDMVYLLSKPTAIKETDWIKPGKVAWDWWHDYVVEGESFRGGVNTQTYLYHIDFAAKYGLEYILIDWLWTDKYDLTLINPDVDIQKITEYARSKNVGVIVWCPGHTLHRQLNKALDLFASLGIAGVKADFFGREDQTGIKMYEDIASATAERKMLIDFHGAAKPTGLSRTYPNVINYEAVMGNEWNKLNADKVTVNHKVMLPFIRVSQGPMDFTPGGMRNLQGDNFLRFTLPNVHGTRSNEMALYVLYFEPLAMLCDAPSVYNREPGITRFIAQIPTTWDESRVLEAKFGENVIIARKTKNTWYIAGITGDKSHQTKLDLSFVGSGIHKATILKDGPNADRVGTDYLLKSDKIDTSKPFIINMVNGGGFVLKIDVE